MQEDAKQLSDFKKIKADFLGPPFTIAKVIQGVYIAK